VVSGDFPGISRKEMIFILLWSIAQDMACRCTSFFHRYFLLNNIVDHSGEHTAASIIDSLHYSVRRTLKQEDNEAEARDGMDIAFCKINYTKKELQFAGAHRPLYLLRDGELTNIKAIVKPLENST
jgi:hypothetical protein